MLTASCHCGAVRIEVDTRPPYLNECHCSICLRYGVRWAYYPPAAVRFSAELERMDMYCYGEKKLGFYRCGSCGCVTHWSSLDNVGNRMGLNGNLFPPAEISNVPIRVTTGPP